MFFRKKKITLCLKIANFIYKHIMCLVDILENILIWGTDKPKVKINYCFRKKTVTIK